MHSILHISTRGCDLTKSWFWPTLYCTLLDDLENYLGRSIVSVHIVCMLETSKKVNNGRILFRIVSTSFEVGRSILRKIFINECCLETVVISIRYLSYDQWIWIEITARKLSKTSTRETYSGRTCNDVITEKYA